jgi:hypothetical protein
VAELALAVKEFAGALLEVEETRDKLQGLVKFEREGLRYADESWESAEEGYSQACARLCRAKDDLEETKSAP